MKIIKARTAQAQSGTFSDWQVALFALLAGILGALLMIVFRRKSSYERDQVVHLEKHEAETDAAAEVLFAGEEPETPTHADDVVQMLNRTEESLGKCEYEQAEETLGKIESIAPTSLRAMVLKAQLYHETDRHEERNALINSISESSDKDRWEQFCQLVPSHVWNACFGDGTAPDDQADGR